ncbi:MAG: hypothetical protein CUN54_04650 [Phototrophicales bacterium]|nr:MAG: hypothetical protein CUN54_04650 [Phototrophicales bacterium]
MSGSAIIEVVIGLIFVFSLLSILVTQINTVIVNTLNLRAKNLKKGMEQLLTDPVVRAKVLCHPLIGLIDHKVGPNDIITPDMAEEIAGQNPTNVSWIEPEKFVSVLKDVLTLTTREELFLDLYRAVDALPVGTEKSQIRELIRGLQNNGTGLPDLHKAIFRLKNEQHKQALMTALDKVEAAAGDLLVENVELAQMMQGIRNIDSEILQNTLNNILETTKDIKAAEARLETWFNTTMDQLSTSFTKRLQYYSLFVGLVLSLTLNVDTLNLATALWNDPALREAVSTAAAAATANPELQEDATGQAAPPTTQQEAVDEARGSLDTLLGLRLPIGWEITSISDEDIAAAEASNVLTDPRDNGRNLLNFWPGNNPGWLGFWLQKIAGWVITMIAIAQGAPFWFNLLNRITGR